ncbi:branched-chain amino acid ABC transporter permease [Caldinitratiruptor microaerophilus]|uniref:Branched-chain amino acid ABC transporter permease n=1 Tax=Caldinitratiruptor microaerophilus TaxID=671077 RepID=A0AA35CIH2_9FIRM|nr:branched-chain amino acid ABC transporter permease [Caldinitratiruptor microaerophilus]BDG59064.1 branched-chain amino acid ABC transporter permease [Caldinitratiruptor microaerophilus]
MALTNAIVNGILMGGIYGLIALGLTLVFGIMRVVNFAHGALLMVSMYAAYFAWHYTRLYPYFTVFVVAPFMFVVGFLLQRYLIRPVFKAEADVREPISALLLTAGLMVTLENMALLFFGADYRTAKTTLSGVTYHLGGISVAAPRLYAFLITLVATVIFYVFLQRTETGRAMRAVGQDRSAAALVGINVYRMYDVAFGVGLALLGVAGSVLVPFYYVQPSVGQIFGTRAFITVVLGGLGSVPGALVGGLLIGIVESVAAQFMESTWTQVLINYGFLAFLFIKPSGLFGSPYDA